MTRTDDRLLRRAAWVMAGQTAVAVAVIVVAMSAVILLVDEHQQHVQADQISRAAWITADDTTSEPVGTWLVTASRNGAVRATPDAPDVVRNLDPRSYPDGASTVHADGRELALWTGDRAAGRISAVYDLSPRELEERRLVVSLGVAALVGIVGAAGMGILLGRRAVRPLGEALAIQRRFVADASHELRTPLTVLFTRAQLHRESLDGAVGGERLAEADRLVADAQVLGEVVNDLLLSTQLVHQPQHGDLVPLGPLAGEVARSMQELAGRRGVTICVAEDRAPQETVVRGAAPALRRALTSLIDNAVAHCAPGGRVDVSVTVRPDVVVVEVKDDGEGLDPRTAQQLVTRFARGTTAGAGRRFGLGLSLVEEVARSHGGSLVIDGEPGAGASFRLHLPRRLPGDTG